MNWQDQLISLYVYICNEYKSHLVCYCLRMSNYADLSFSDEEVLTIYLFGVLDKHRTLKEIYGYADRHLRDWFPKLPSYTGFIQRINRIQDVFVPMIESLQSHLGGVCEGQVFQLMDSMPIILAQRG